MRVIAGELRGRTLRAPMGLEVRPTPDRVREAIFSMLGGMLRGERVLDLFAGSGALGIEALSRGAASAVFVEHSQDAADLLRANLLDLGLGPDRARVERADAFDWLARAGRPGAPQFELAFLDPPYALELDGRLARALPPLLAAGARVVCESAVVAVPMVELPQLRERRYGSTLIRIHEL